MLPPFPREEVTVTRQKLGSLEGKLENVLIDSVLRDDSYQREVQRHHAFIAENFDRAAAGHGTVARRADGTTYWIDGLQRAAAMKKLGIDRWRCLVIESSGPRFEASVFKLMNGREGRKGLNPNQLFKAALTEEDPVALAAERAASASGFLIRREGGVKDWPVIGSAGLLYRSTRSYGEAAVARGLSLVARTWPQVNDALHQTILGAVLMIVHNRGDALDEAHFAAQVGAMIPRSILMNVKGIQGGSTYGRVCDELIKRYNRNLRGKARLRLFRDDAADGKADGKDVA